MLYSAHMQDRHKVTVFQIRWIPNKNSSKKERLISIASDGKILEWQIQKCMKVKSLMMLKRVIDNNEFIARYAAGKTLKSLPHT